jgi:hypothetical protein
MVTMLNKTESVKKEACHSMSFSAKKVLSNLLIIFIIEGNQVAESKSRKHGTKKSDEEMTPKDMTDNEDGDGDWSGSANKNQPI